MTWDNHKAQIVCGNNEDHYHKSYLIHTYSFVSTFLYPVNRALSAVNGWNDLQAARQISDAFSACELVPLCRLHACAPLFSLSHRKCLLGSTSKRLWDPQLFRLRSLYPCHLCLVRCCLRSLVRSLWTYCAQCSMTFRSIENAVPILRRCSAFTWRVLREILRIENKFIPAMFHNR